MGSKIWSRIHAVLAVLCWTLAPLATASAGPTEIPLRGTLYATGLGVAGPVSGLGWVVAQQVSPLQVPFTTRSGDVLVGEIVGEDRSGDDRRYHVKIDGGTGRFQGATGEYSVTVSGANPWVASVDGVLILP